MRGAWPLPLLGELVLMNLIALPTTATSKFVLVLGPPQCDGGATLQLYVVKALVIV
jgi:hypothetical protein